MNTYTWTIDPSYGAYLTMFRLFIGGHKTDVVLSLEVKQELHSTMRLDLRQEVINLIIDELRLTQEEATKVVDAFIKADPWSNPYSNYDRAMKIVEKR